MKRARPAWLENWLQRHQSRFSFWLHMIGIPLTIAAVLLGVYQIRVFDWPNWWRPLLLGVFGYFLQWMGHVYEGNDMGEIVLIKKLLGRPYVDVAPRYVRARETESLTDRQSPVTR